MTAVCLCVYGGNPDAQNATRDLEAGMNVFNLTTFIWYIAFWN